MQTEQTQFRRGVLSGSALGERYNRPTYVLAASSENKSLSEKPLLKLFERFLFKKDAYF